MLNAIIQKFGRSKNNLFPDKKIIIVSLQKSGTHLIKNIIEALGFETVWTPENCKVNDFKRLQENQVYISHFPPADNVQMALEGGQDNYHIVFCYRDPRDILVSWFYWMHPEKGGKMHLHQEYMRKVYKSFSEEEIIDFFIRNEKFRVNEYNPIEAFRHSRILLFHPGVLNVRFEHLIGANGGGDDEKQIETLKSIINYLGVTNIDVNQVVEKCFDRSSATFRKGQIGDYKNVLSEKQLKLFHELHKDILIQYDYPLDF